MSNPESPPLASEQSGPDAIRRNFVAVALATDTPEPGDGLRLPVVPMSPDMAAIARTVGMILHSAPIFRFGKSIVTVDAAGGIEAMSPIKFTTWVNNYFKFTRPGLESPTIFTIGKDKAAQILEADQFRDHLRELKAVSPVRVPVWRNKSNAPWVELAPEGYDADMGLLTLNTIPFQEDLSVNDAVNFLFEVKGEFPYELEGQKHVIKSRSFSVHMALTIGVFCHALFPESTARPVGGFLATQSGTGKSLANRLSLCAVYGLVGENDMPKDDKALQTLLESVALQRSPILVLDNCYTLKSAVFDRFVTAPVHNPRLFNQQATRTVPNCTQCFVSGNNLTLSEDLARRTLRVDLFVPGEAKGRKFKKRLTSKILDDPTFRGKMLAAQWALVRDWRDHGMPMMDEVFDSFEEWSAVMGGIVMHHGLMNPFTPPPGEYGGDEVGLALRKVLANLVGAASIEERLFLTPTDVLERAEGDGLLDVIVPFAKDATSTKKSLGHKLKHLRGRHLRDSQGRTFEFGRRESGAGARYDITFLRHGDGKPSES